MDFYLGLPSVDCRNMTHEVHIEHVIVAVLVLIVLRNLLDRYQAQRDRQKKGEKKGLPRAWRPHNTKRCPACRAGACLPALHPRREVTLWTEVKSKRGCRKEIDNEGQCCLNLFCLYFGITDAVVRALVEDGVQGPDNIQLLRSGLRAWVFLVAEHTIVLPQNER
jgi:hypothetical protein